MSCGFKARWIRMSIFSVAALVSIGGHDVCAAYEFGPSCKKFVQEKADCLEANAKRMDADGNAAFARELRRSIPFEMHSVFYTLAKAKKYRDIEHDCRTDSWLIENPENPENPHQQRSMQLCAAHTSWPANYQIKPDSDPEIESAIKDMEEKSGMNLR